MKIAISKASKDLIEKTKRKDLFYIFQSEEEINDIDCEAINYKYTAEEEFDIAITDLKIDATKIITPLEAQKLTLEQILEPPKIKEYKIAIIIPNFNYGEWLEKCIKSILEQTYKNYEIIFVDDMSTDNSLEIANKLLKNHKVISLKQKRLNGGARNEAYLHLSEDVDYVWYVDSDDWLINNEVLTNINKKLQSNPDVLFVGMSYFDGKETKLYDNPNYKNKYEAFKGWSGSCGKVIKKELATRQECLYNEGTLLEDKNQHCRICFYMKTFANYSKPVYVWNRTNKKSVTSVRDIMWKTSTYRHYADTKQFYLSIKGQDKKIDEIMENRLKTIEQEIKSGGDRQW